MTERDWADKVISIGIPIGIWYLLLSYSSGDKPVSRDDIFVLAMLVLWYFSRRSKGKVD